MAAWAASVAEDADDWGAPTWGKLDMLVDGMLGSNKPAVCECFLTWPARAGGRVKGEAFLMLEPSLADRLGREKFWGLPRPGELGKNGLVRVTGVCGVLVLGRVTTSSVEEVSIFRIMGRVGMLAAALAAAAALEEPARSEVDDGLPLMEPGTRGEKLPGARCCGRDGCIVLSAVSNVESLATDLDAGYSGYMTRRDSVFLCWPSVVYEKHARFGLVRLLRYEE